MRADSAFSGGFWASPAALAVAMLGSAGCTSELRLSEVRDPSQPTCTIRYAAIRQDVRRFPDYSGIDGSILTDRSSEPTPDGRGVPRP